MKTKTKRTLFGREWQYYLDDYTKIVIRYHWAEFGVSARLYRLGELGWKTMAWTYPEVHKYDPYIHDIVAFNCMREYLIWAEKHGAKIICNPRTGKTKFTKYQEK